MASPFHSLDDYIALPRIEALALSPDGSRVVLTVATLNKDKTAYDRSLWEVAADGSGSPKRLTRSAKGEAGAAFLPNGDVVFVSARPDSDAAADDESGQLWVLPAGGGEARPATRLAGGVSAIAATAEASDLLVVSADLLRSAEGIEADAKLRARRKKLTVSAILHDSYPVRYWDHDLGPAEPHLFALDLDGLADTIAAVAIEGDTGADDGDEGDEKDEDAAVPYPTTLPRPLDLTPRPGRTADIAGAALTPDGATLIASLRVPQGRDARYALVAIDTATGDRTTLFDEPSTYHEAPVISHDGSTVAYVRAGFGSPAGPADQELWVAGIDGSHPRRLADGWDRWATGIVFDADDSALIVTADQDGRGPIFRIPLAGGPVEQLTQDDFTYTHVRVDRSTGDLTALRSSWVVPPQPVRIGRGGAVRSPAATRSCCPIRPCRPATGWSSSPAAGTAGAEGRSPTSWPSPTPSRRGTTSTRRRPRRWADHSGVTWRTGSPATSTGSAPS